MKVVKKTPEYTVYEKRSKRYAVRNADNNWVNGDDKLKILVAEKLVEIKLPAPKVEAAAAAEPETAEVTEAAGEEATEGEAPAE